jgi:3-phosphoshikimate 1-carboxyvinyltransferase
MKSAGPMRSVVISRQKPLKLTTALPGDKSISHRSIMMGALAKGQSRVKNFLTSEDCQNTAKIFEAMGVKIRREARSKNRLIIDGVGLKGLRKPKTTLYCGNSGTTMRLMSGILAAQPFTTRLAGDPSLSGRPMNRAAAPLILMGADIKGKGAKITAPLTICGRQLKGTTYRLPVASAQVKSAALLAGLFAEGPTTVIEEIPTRDHTERFFKYTGLDLTQSGHKITLHPGREPRPFKIEVPGDISSAAFLIAIGLLVPGSRISLKRVLWNPVRIGIIRALNRMGAGIKPSCLHQQGPEITADFEVSPRALRATTVQPSEVPSLIDELPILMVIATQAQGKSWFHGVEELRVKETDRVASMVDQLKLMGARIGVKGNSVWVDGPTPLRASKTPLQSYGDHRTAMSFIVAGMIADGQTRIKDTACIATSFPNFFELLVKAGAKYSQQQTAG